MIMRRGIAIEVKYGRLPFYCKLGHLKHKCLAKVNEPMIPISQEVQSNLYPPPVILILSLLVVVLQLLLFIKVRCLLAK